MAHAVANAQPRQAVDLRECSKHKNIPAGAHIIERVGIVRPLHVIMVGLVQHHENARWKGFEEPVKLFRRKHGSGRVVRIAQVDDLGALRHGALNGSQIAGEIAHGGRDQTCTHFLDGSPVNVKRRLRSDPFIPGGQKGLGHKLDEVGGACTQNHLIHLQLVILGKRFAQVIAVSVRIKVQLLQRFFHRPKRCRRRAERILV